MFALASALVMSHSFSWSAPSPRTLLPVGTVLLAENRLKFQWPSSGFDVRFKGASLVLDIDDSASGEAHAAGGPQSNSIEVRIDGGPSRKVTLSPGRNRLILAEGLAAGPHIAFIRKRTESHVGVITLHGLDAPGGSIEKPSPPSRRLTLYGDSNSCGYGAEAPSRDIKYSPATQNSEAAFPALAARSLGLELNLIAASGWGIMRGYGGDSASAIPRVWRRVLIDQELPEATGPEPACIMVVLGDNDFAQGDPGPQFDEAYLTFTKGLRARHPNSPIILCTSSFMQGTGPNRRVGDAIDFVVKELKDPKITRFNLPAYQESWGFGADWHISLEGHRRISGVLIHELEMKRIGRRVSGG